MFQQAVARVYPHMRLADAMAGVERQQQEFQQLQAWLQRQQADRQVPYVVTYPHLVVTESWLMGSAKVTSLQAGTRVVVCELAHQDNGKRVRGRICDPAGWITLLDQCHQMRGAMVQPRAPGPIVMPPHPPGPWCGLPSQPELGPHGWKLELFPQCRQMPTVPEAPEEESEAARPHSTQTAAPPIHSSDNAVAPASGVVISTLERKWELCQWLGSHWWNCLDEERSSFWRGRPPQDWIVRWGDQRRGYVWFNSDTQELFCEGALALEDSALASGVVISSLERRWKLYQCLGREFWYCLDQERSSFFRSRPPQPWTVTKLRRGYFWFNSDTQERFWEGALEALTIPDYP